MPQNISSVTPDRRILRTKKAIRQAFLVLLTENRFEEITVSGLAEKAGINRKTFYLHYTSTRELLDEIRVEQSRKISQLSCWKTLGELSPDPYEVFLEMNQLIHEDTELYRAMLSPTSGIITSEQIKDKILKSDDIKKICRLRPDIEYYIDYTVSGLFSLYLRWLAKPNQISIEELACIASELTKSGLAPLKEFVEKNPALISSKPPKIATKGVS